MRLRLIALDMDGTLLNDEKEISVRNRAALQRAAAAGVTVALSTARPSWSARAYEADLGIKVAMVNSNGAEVWRPGGDRPVFRRTLESDLLAELLQVERPGSTRLMRFYATEESFGGEPRLINWTEGAWPELPGPLTQVIYIADEDDITHFMDQLADRFGDRIALNRSDPIAVQVNAPGVSKGDGLARLAAAIGVAAEQVLAMGNGENDLPMLDWAGAGYVMANAPESVLRLARQVAPRHDEDGVAQIVEELLG
ncbi:MAG: Cof-type HAD-IIB family hydrolase [Mycobacterium leprae]